MKMNPICEQVLNDSSSYMPKHVEEFGPLFRPMLAEVFLMDGPVRDYFYQEIEAELAVDPNAFNSMDQQDRAYFIWLRYLEYIDVGPQKATGDYRFQPPLQQTSGGMEVQ